MSNVVNLFDSSYKDIPSMLRKIADSIDQNEYGNITTCVVVTEGDMTTCLAFGEESTHGDAVLALLGGIDVIKYSKYQEDD